MPALPDESTMVHESPQVEQAGSVLQRTTTGRLEAGDFKLYDIDTNLAKGLGIVTKAIYNSEVEIGERKTIAATFKSYTGCEIDLSSLSTKECNTRLAALVRDACATGGWLAGWNCLIQAAPDVGLHSRLAQDVNLGSGVYSRVRSGSRKREPISDIKISVGREANNDSIFVVGPKSMGGNAWKVSEEYAAVLQRPQWRDPGYTKGYSPCVAWGWVAVLIKVIPAEDEPDAMRLMLLNTVDYDLDIAEDNKGGFENGFRMGAHYSIEKGSSLQQAAFCGMISHDFQTFVRSIQHGWIAKKGSGWNMGLQDASPEEWAALNIADCAAIVPFAFETPDVYDYSRTGMISGMFQLQCHDYLFDTGCLSRVSVVAYSEAAGVGVYNMHTAFCIGFYEAIAQYFLDSLLRSGDGVKNPYCLGDGVKPPYGYAACMCAGPWAPFNTRYRAFERCIKYTRQLQRSKSSEAKAILDMARQDLVLRDCVLDTDVGKHWARAVKSDASDLVPRKTVKYFIPSIALELFDSPGVAKPELCTKCGPSFLSVMSATKREEVHAIGGLSEVITGCRGAGLAAGIRRATLWASTDDCCDSCASRIGCWTDATAYTVLSALMHDEPMMGPSTWSLQNYFVGAVTLWPIELPALLTGFELLAPMSFDDGAMGHRDIVDI